MDFYNIISQSADYIKLQQAITKQQLPAMAVGLCPIHKALVISALCKSTDRKALVITADEAQSTALRQDLCELGCKTLMLPVIDLSLRDVDVTSHDYEQARTDTLFKLLKGDFSVCIAPVQAALMLTVPPDIILQNTLTINEGDTLDPEKMAGQLIAAGYTRCDAVDGAGQFAIRGGIADIYGAGSSQPVRIEFFGDTVDTLSYYDNFTGRRTEKINQITLPPAKEILCDTSLVLERLEGLYNSKHKLSDKAKQRLMQDIDLLKSGISFPLDRHFNLLFDNPCSLLDYLPDAMMFVSDIVGIEQRRKSYEALFNEEYVSLFEDGMIAERKPHYFLSKDEFVAHLEKKAIYLETFSRSNLDTSLKELITFSARQLPCFSGDIKILCDDITAVLKNGNSVIVMAGVEKAALSLCSELVHQGFDAIFSENDTFKAEGVTVVCGGLSSGLELTDSKITIFTHSALRQHSKRRKVPKNAAPLGSLEELKAGDFVVHAAHGIGIFQGVHRINNHGVIKDYIKISYAKGDILYVPVIQLDSVSRYIGAKDDSLIKLSRLGTQDWQRARTKVKAAVKDLADSLIKLYAKRMSQKGYAFSPDSDLQRDFECRFEYEETEDQLRCAQEIKADMERDVPMDRLLCGDVGFGKTEVALRAAFKCILDGKQCALLVPTTILAWQHYQTAVRRFGELPVNTEMLSRFVMPKKQKQVLDNLKVGGVDLVIGTHRAISKDVHFRDLGLLIIDEEQRFGVAQKESLKERYPNVDILTLSATPIPRTLNMAVSGLRDMSSLDEAPEDRLPVQTYVLEQDNNILYEAIKRELRRGGQVYYLHNRVDSIYACASRIKAALPECRIEVAHGKMAEDELSGVWERLLSHEIDVLVCTTIIETGVDVPNANTLIIENADKFGLAQLHQLRGRVGRSPRRAYAYFCFKHGAALSEIAQKRLQAIREFTEFGSGFKIAMRDLEIRGAGDLLGASQHGHMAAVGYDTYIKLLEESILEQKGELPKTKPPCIMDLDISAHIPENYMPALTHRLHMYRRIADICNNEQYDDVMEELCDRFGEPPKQVIALMDIALLRRKAADVGIIEIKQLDGQIKFFVESIKQEYTLALYAEFGKRVNIGNAERPFYRIAITPKYTPKDIVSLTIDTFASCTDNN